jgi:hypothetical protein
LCVFNKYSKYAIEQLLNYDFIKPDDKLTENDYLKLFHVHYWLKLENFEELSLPPELVIKMLDFKADWDSKPHTLKPYSSLKTTVKNTLLAENYQFKENHFEFPFFSILQTLKRSLRS